MALKKISSFLLRLSWLKLDHRDGLKDIFIGCFFILFLSFFLNSKEIPIDHLELNSIADKYIIAQTEFEFPDTETTRILKQESIRDLGMIYYLQETDVVKVEKKIQESLIGKPFWRQRLPTATFEELIAASDTLRDVLLTIKITDSRTLAKLKQIGRSGKTYLVCAIDNPVEALPGEFWEKIEQKAFRIKTPATHFILEQYRSYPLALEQHLEKQHSLSRLIKDSIPLKMTKVAPGTRIINTGDKVTLRHIDMLKGMKKKLTEQYRFTASSLIGSLGLALVMTLVGWVYIQTLYPSVLASTAKKAVIATVIILTLFLSKLTEYLLINKMGYLADVCRFPIFVPFATLMLAILIDRKTATIVSQFVTLVLATTLILHYQHFLIVNVCAALVSTILVKTVRRRKEIFEICAKIWIVTLPLILGVNLMEGAPWDYHVFIDFATSLVSMTIIAVLIVTILPVLESAYGIVTDMTLLESADLSHPLLRRLNLEAPGTYRHSLAVAALAEEAALAIDANPIFCRVASLYHDIGKLSQPQYFTENQFYGFNMHQLLTPLESAQVIIAHVTEGVKLAQQYELPRRLIDVIKEHHGQGLVYYFYHAQIEQSRTTTLVVEEGRFRYPGPTPRSQESAIIMLADSIEAAYRSLEEVSEKAVTELVVSIVSDKVRDHQLDTSHLTFDEIEKIKKTMIRSLMANAHGRIKYPGKPTPPIPPTPLAWHSEEPVVHLS